MRLIDADELKAAFPCGESVRTESVRATIDHMATVDAEPVRHEHWKEHKDYPGLAYLCSGCGYFTTDRSYYCPCCGAKMDEDEVKKNDSI